MNTVANLFRSHASMPGIKSHVGWSEELLNRLELPKITLYEMLSRNVEQNADKPIIWFLNTFMTYRQFIDDVDRLAASLHRLGLRKGDVVALIMPSCFQYPIAYYACAKLGIIVTESIQHINPPRPFPLGDGCAPSSRWMPCDLLIRPILSSFRSNGDRNKLGGSCDIEKESGKESGLSTGQRRTIRSDFGPVECRRKRFRRQYLLMMTYVMTGGTTGVPKRGFTHYNCVSRYSSPGDMEHKSGCPLILPMSMYSA